MASMFYHGRPKSDTIPCRCQASQLARGVGVLLSAQPPPSAVLIVCARFCFLSGRKRTVGFVGGITALGVNLCVLYPRARRAGKPDRVRRTRTEGPS